MLFRLAAAVRGGRLGVALRELRICQRLSVVGSGRDEAGSEVAFAGRGESEGKGKTVKLSVSSLRIDAVAAAGLDISRQKIWEAALDNLLWLNGETVKKKSASVSEGDIIEVDTILRDSAINSTNAVNSDEESGSMVRRGRVEVVEIGERTRKGGYQLTLTRYKHFSKFYSKPC